MGYVSVCRYSILLYTYFYVRRVRGTIIQPYSSLKDKASPKEAIEQYIKLLHDTFSCRWEWKLPLT